MSLLGKTILYPRRGSVLVTGPASEPVTADELRAHLVDTSLSDDDADALISEARELVEDDIGAALIAQTWRLALDRWPSHGGPWWDGVRQGPQSILTGIPAFVVLPRWPLASVTSVKVYDQSGTETAVDVAATFDVDTFQRPGRLALKSGNVWPVAMRETNAVIIDYVAGFSSVPGALKRAVMMMAAHLYANRGDCSGASDAAVRAILDRYRIGRV